MNRDSGSPAAARRVAWPTGWSPRFAIFVDVEEEFDWSAPFSREARSTAAVPALLPFAERMAERGVGVTYLTDHPVATCPRSAEVLRRIAALPGAEIGTQLHPWVNPPHDEALSLRASYAGNLPEALEAAKIDALTDAITRAVGTPPRAYRAGRYGLGPNTARLLAARGYRLDTSVRAGFDYRADGGPDFRRSGNESALPCPAHPGGRVGARGGRGDRAGGGGRAARPQRLVPLALARARPHPLRPRRRRPRPAPRLVGCGARLP